MHLPRRAVEALALLAATAALAAADSTTFPPGEISGDESHEVVEHVLTTFSSGLIEYSLHRQYNSKCLPVQRNFSLSCEDVLLCEDDGSCSDDKICCPNDCGGVECQYPMFKGQHPPIDEKEENSTESMSDIVTKDVDDGWVLIEEVKPNPPKLLCPIPDPHKGGVCANVCNECREGQLCCPNNCGGKECMDAVSDEPIAETEGPPVTETSPEPVTETGPPVTEIPPELMAETEGPPVTETPSDPTAETEGPPMTTTLSETKIPARGLETSVPKYYYKLPLSVNPFVDWLHNGHCPEVDLQTSNCGKSCRIWACPEGQKCCPNSCGERECMPVEGMEQPVRKENERYIWDLYATNSINQYQNTIYQYHENADK